MQPNSIDISPFEYSCSWRSMRKAQLIHYSINLLKVIYSIFIRASNPRGHLECISMSLGDYSLSQPILNLKNSYCRLYINICRPYNLHKMLYIIILSANFSLDKKLNIMDKNICILIEMRTMQLDTQISS